MLKLEIDDKKYEIPQSFAELTLEQYCKAFYKLPHPTDDMDDIEKFKLIKENEAIILSRIMGEADGFCLDLPLNVYAQLNEAISFIYDSDYFMRTAKASIVIDNKRYSIPSMDKMSMRQFIDADVVLNDDESDMQYIELLSILLLSKDKDGKYIPYNGDYKDMVEKVRKLTCDKALGLVYHFFKKGEALQKLSRASMKVEEVSRQLQSTPSS
jgi:hypothetical protein